MSLQLNPSLRFKRISDNCFLIRNLSSGKFWKVTEFVIISLAHFGDRVIEEAQLVKNGVAPAPKLPEKIILDEFAKRSWILESGGQNECSTNRKSPSYIALSFVILPASVVNCIGQYLKVLFKKEVFFLLFVSCTCMLLKSTLNQPEILLQSEQFIPFVVMMFFSVFLHELGHTSALVYAGEKAGSVGGGFYLFAPIMYADVTNGWALDSRDRQRVNIGGIYFEMVFFAIFYSLFEITGYSNLQNILILIGLKSFWNLNPLLRSDGYWLLSDGIGISNLYQKSFAEWKQLLSKNKAELSPVLLVYGALSILTISLSVYYTFSLNHAHLISLPRTFLMGVLNVANGQAVRLEISELFGILPILVLYYLIGKLVILGCKKVLTRCF